MGHSARPWCSRALAALSLLLSTAALGVPSAAHAAVAIRVTARPAATTSAPDATIRFVVRGARNPAVTCATDARRAMPCRSPLALRRLAAGAHRVTIRARSGKQQAAVTVRWMVDVTPPSAPTLAGASSAWVAAASRTVTAAGAADAGSGVARYEHAVSPDGVTWSPVATGATVTVTAEGRTRVRARAVDGAGNASAWREASVGLDRSRPLGAFTSPPPAWLATAPPGGVRLAVTGSDALSGLATIAYRVAVGGGAPSAPSTTPPTVTSDGRYRVTATLTDAAGNTTTIEHAFGLDHVPPTTPAVSASADAWVTPGAAFVAAAQSVDATSPTVTYEHRTSRDGEASWSPPAPGAHVTFALEGETLVQFRARDAAGNASPWTPSVRVRVDGTAPSPPVLVGGDPAWRTGQLTLVAVGASDSLSGVAGYEYQQTRDDGASWSPIAGSGPTRSFGDDIDARIRVRALDAAGNATPWASSTDGSTTVRIDATPPSVSWDAPSGWQTAAFSHRYLASDAGSGVAASVYDTSYDLETWEAFAIAPGQQVGLDADVSYYVRATVTDAVGNTASATHLLRLDQTPPSAPTLTGGSDAWQFQTAVRIAASGSTDATSGLDRYMVRTSSDAGGTWSAYETLYLDRLDVLEDGDLLVDVVAVDAAGNRSSATRARVRHEHAAPVAPTVTGGSSEWSHAASVTFVMTSGSAASGVDYHELRWTRDDGDSWLGPFPTMGSRVELGVSAEGVEHVQFRTVSRTGRTSAWRPALGSAAGTAKLDRTPPSVPTISASPDGPVADVTIAGAQSTDALSGLARYVAQVSRDDGETWADAADPDPAGLSTHDDEAITHVRYASVDHASNRSAWSDAVAVEIDATPPTPPQVAVDGTVDAWTNVPVTFHLDSQDAVGVAGYLYERRDDGSQTWEAPAPIDDETTLTVSRTGVTWYRFLAYDAAGHASATSAAYRVRYDDVATAPVVVEPDASWTDEPTVTYTVRPQADGASGFLRAEAEFSDDGGDTWSAGSIVLEGAAVGQDYQLSWDDEGDGAVRVSTIDAAGNRSTWVTRHLRLDWSPPELGEPTRPSAWALAANATDAGSGVASVEYRYSTDGGGSWSEPQPGPDAAFVDPGVHLVQFRATDELGFRSAWSPASPGPADTVTIPLF